MTFYIRPQSEDLMHYGIKGQKWGIRRFQNPDGSLTDAGKRRYNKLQNRIEKIAQESYKLEKLKPQLIEARESAKKEFEKSGSYLDKMTLDNVNRLIEGTRNMQIHNLEAYKSLTTKITSFYEHYKDLPATVSDVIMLGVSQSIKRDSK